MMTLLTLAGSTLPGIIVPLYSAAVLTFAALTLNHFWNRD